MKKSSFLSGTKYESLAFAEESLISALPLVESIPAVQNYVRSALQIAREWGLDAEEFLNQAFGKLNKTARSA